MRQCPLCLSKEAKLFYVHKKAGEYFHCEQCDLRFLAAEFYADTTLEKQVYLQHTNEMDNPYYLDFISPVVAVSKKHILPQQVGLDYGCGYSPLLAKMLNDDGYNVKHYDPMFFADPMVLKNTYDYVICTEVVEHFKGAGEELSKLLSLLKPGGILIVMTLLYNTDIEFAHWHYRRDPTHVSFFTTKTISYICKKWDLKAVHSDDKRLFVFKKITDKH